MKPSPLQNRVDPFGTLHAVPARGMLMGNRGILHGADGRIQKPFAHRTWVTCLLSFKGRARDPMPDGRYTALFFLDEATAFAAGHRPCGECRHARYREFTQAWLEVFGAKPVDRALPAWIDAALHAARIDHRRKVTYPANPAALPDGTMIAMDDQPFLLSQGRAHPWRFDGYGPPRAALPSRVAVLTPAPIVSLFAAGFRPHTAL